MRSYTGNLVAENGSTRATTNTFKKGDGIRSMIPETDVTVTALIGGNEAGDDNIDFEAKYNLTEMKQGQLYTVAADEFITSINTDGVVICY